MESCSNQKSVKQTQIYLRFYKVTTLCLDDSFAHSRHSLNQLHEVVTWNAFGLREVVAHLRWAWDPYLGIFTDGSKDPGSGRAGFVSDILGEVAV